LPNVAAAIRERKVVRLLVLGSAGTSRQFAGNDQDFLLEHLIEKTVKGLQIEIIDRGISGELARNAAARLEVEVALGRPDAVLWQVGTMDALAGIPASSVRTTVTQSIRWLKAHQVDVVLIGLQYARQLRKDRDYQKIRQTLREITSSEKVMLVERYEAEEILDNVRRAKKDYLESKFDQNERGYNCVAEYVAKAIVGGVLIRQQNRPNPK
jgi:lysophospholipase L1-like esterase